jgi:hypothetical protein
MKIAIVLVVLGAVSVTLVCIGEMEIIVNF